jgi:hypothetical protein
MQLMQEGLVKTKEEILQKQLKITTWLSKKIKRDLLLLTGNSVLGSTLVKTEEVWILDLKMKFQCTRTTPKSEYKIRCLTKDSIIIIIMTEQCKVAEVTMDSSKKTFPKDTQLLLLTRLLRSKQIPTKCKDQMLRKEVKDQVMMENNFFKRVQ